MQLNIRINMDNSAFFDETIPQPSRGLECARILHELAKLMENEPDLADGWGQALFDTNGNMVGAAIVAAQSPSGFIPPMPH